MFAKLTGTVDSVTEDQLILDVGGVGYLVAASAKTLAQLEPGAAISLLIDTQIGEDHIRLFGFRQAEEQRWFRLLQAVQGVGGKVALAVLSVLAPGDLARAIAAQDKAAVGRANGVGPKLAQRIVTELKDKAGLALGPVAAGEAPVLPRSGGVADALSALANHAARTRLGDDAPVAALIKAALQEAAK
jgi:holliday junction DNA helicase RuvA